jgi:hypothetical protein
MYGIYTTIRIKKFLGLDFTLQLYWENLRILIYTRFLPTIGKKVVSVILRHSPPTFPVALSGVFHPDM